jgi:hypothetical protein
VPCPGSSASASGSEASARCAHAAELEDEEADEEVVDVEFGEDIMCDALRGGEPRASR